MGASTEDISYGPFSRLAPVRSDIIDNGRGNLAPCAAGHTTTENQPLSSTSLAFIDQFSWQCFVPS